MDIADEIAHRALSYVAAVSSNGYPLTVDEFTAYVDNPLRSRRSKGGLLSDVIMGSAATWTLMAGTTEVEPVLDWLLRLQWLDVSNDNSVRLTRLGTAVLNSLEQQKAVETTPVVSILNSEDPIAYPQVIQAIANRSKALLVDPYFRLESFPHVVHYTSVSRLLTGKRADLQGLAVARSSLPEGRSLEIRVSNEVHDRFVIPPHGDVDMLGTSLSGVGKKFTLMTSIKPPAADSVRAAHEELWSDGKNLAAAATGDTRTPQKRRRRANQ
jgi:hypothetical protein